MSSEIPAEPLKGEPLPGSPGTAVTRVWEALGSAQRAALWPHLVGSTSAERLALVLTDEGHRIGATSIKAYRRSLRQDGS